MLAPNGGSLYSKQSIAFGIKSRTSRSMRREIAAVLVLLIFGLFIYDASQTRAGRGLYRDVLSKHLPDLEGRMTRSRRVLTQDPRGWPGWRNIKEIYAFGDSHTYTGFQIRGRQPDDHNPLGNPQWPGLTLNQGPNFLGHLTATFNQSVIRTYNMAGRGSSFLPSESSTAYSLYQQVEQKFYRKYGKSDKFVAEARKGSGLWTQAESLFVVYLGVDDILLTFKARGGGRNDSQVEEHMDEYERSLTRLYEYGARNFLLVNYPELEKSPFMRGSDIPRNFLDMGAELVQYNARLAFIGHQLSQRHRDVNIFVFDNHKISLAVRDTPTAFPETAKIEHLEGFCYPYRDDNHGTKGAAEVFNELCGVALDGWFWRDEQHQTEPYHKLLARLMVEHMSDLSNRLPYEFY